MAETAAKTGAAEAYYTTARSLGTGTTSTISLEIWRMLSNHLEEKQGPMTGSELAAAVGLTLAQIDHIFSQSYYQKHYGFRRFDSYEAWKDWAMAEGILYNPALHDAHPVADQAEEAEAEEDEPGTEE